MSLAKSATNKGGKMLNQEVSAISCPISASPSAQRLPSRKIWEQITVRPLWVQLCQRFRRMLGIREGLWKAWTALLESVSSHKRNQFLETVNSQKDINYSTFQHFVVKYFSLVKNTSLNSYFSLLFEVIRIKLICYE